MLGFRKGWQLFKEGLDRKNIREYWVAVWHHAWEIWWGAGVIGTICTLVTIYYAPSRWILGWVFAWLFIVAGYFTWRPLHVRLTPIIRAVAAHLEPSVPFMENGVAVDQRSFIQVVLKCPTGGTIYECAGYLQRVRYLSKDNTWERTALNESLRLGWSNHSDVEITQHSGSEHNLNVAFVRYSDHRVFPWVNGEMPTRASSVFGDWPQRCGSTFRFDIQITGSDRIDGNFISLKSINICLEAYFDNEPNKPKIKLVEPE